MARSTWRPYRIVQSGSSVEVSSAEFQTAEKDFYIQRCAKDRRKGYLRDDVYMYRDAQTGQTRFAIKDPAPHDPYAIQSWLGRMIERFSIYAGKPNSEFYLRIDTLYLAGAI